MVPTPHRAVASFTVLLVGIGLALPAGAWPVRHIERRACALARRA